VWPSPWSVFFEYYPTFRTPIPISKGYWLRLAPLVVDKRNGSSVSSKERDAKVIWPGIEHVIDVKDLFVGDITRDNTTLNGHRLEMLILCRIPSE